MHRLEAPVKGFASQMLVQKAEDSAKSHQNFVPCPRLILYVGRCSKGCTTIGGSGLYRSEFC